MIPTTGVEFSVVGFSVVIGSISMVCALAQRLNEMMETDDIPEQGASVPIQSNRIRNMWTVVVALVALWILGWATGIGNLGNLVHILLLLAVVVSAVNLVRTGRPV